MARQINRLTALSVSRAKKPGMYADGGGLWLQVTSETARSWLFRFALNGRSREMGLGSLNTVSLAEARERAAEGRKALLAGIDPIEARRDAKTRARLAAANAVTFEFCAEACIEARKAGWKNPKHSAQWRSTLSVYAYPAIGKVPVQQIDADLVVKVLDPIWPKITETASRVRQRIEAVLDWATVRGYRSGDNPARWKGHLSNVFPKRSAVQRVQHHPALPYAEIGSFMKQLNHQSGVAAEALRFTILTAARTEEITAARWSEVDLDNALWIIPAGRMKAGKIHRVPLSAPAVAILRKRKKESTGDFIFEGDKPGRPLSNNAMLALLKRMGRSDITVHGFRSTFRDWADEKTDYSSDVAEASLAHAIKNKVEAAYRRGDLFEKRRSLMNVWAKYCGTAQAADKARASRRSA